MTSPSPDELSLAGTLVVLRTIVDDDVETLVAARCTGVGTLGPPPGAADIAAFRERLTRHLTLEADGFLELAIEATGAVVGDCQVRAPKNASPPGVCEIGILLAPSVRGRGYGTDAVRVLTRHLLDTGWDRIQASTAVENVAMRAVLADLGFTCEGIARGFAPGPPNGIGADGRHDYAVYAFVRGDELG